MVIFSLIFSFLILHAAPLDESFNCKGNLLVVGAFREKLKKINDGQSPFRFDRKDTTALSLFLPEEDRPFVKIFPWNGINYKKLVAKNDEPKVIVKTTGEKYFYVEVKKDKKSFQLSCKYFE